MLSGAVHSHYLRRNGENLIQDCLILTGFDGRWSATLRASKKFIHSLLWHLTYEHHKMIHSRLWLFAGGSLSEVFYGLTRFNLKTEQFSTRDYVVSMVFLVGLPYLTRKLEQRMKQLKEKLEDELTTDDKMQLLQLYTYRSVKVSLAIAQIIRYVSYLSGRSSSHSLQLMVSRIGLRHSSPQVNAFSWSDLMHGNVRISTLLSTVVLRSLEFGGFFLQFLQWFNESSTTPQTISKMSIPDPPPPDANAHRYYNTCPICLQDFQIPTILRISGYVFCYKCITNHLKKHKFCPVTTYPATMDDLVRMFDNWKCNNFCLPTLTTHVVWVIERIIQYF